jgi:hypothetical protein
MRHIVVKAAPKNFGDGGENSPKLSKGWRKKGAEAFIFAKPSAIFPGNAFRQFVGKPVGEKIYSLVERFLFIAN